MTFLKQDSEARGATILCELVQASAPAATNPASSITDATHIFDGLNNFPTHVAHMHLGTFLMEPTSWPFTNGMTGATSVDLGPSPTLYSLALQWLKEDRERRKALEAQGRKRRGARTDTVSISSEGGRLCGRLV